METVHMRQLMLAGVLGVFLLCAGCGDLPTQASVAPDPTSTTALSDQQTSTTCCAPVIVIVPGGCDPYTDLNWCEGDGDCQMSEPGTGDPENAQLAGCGEPPKLPGGGGYKPPAPTEPVPTEPADTCKTGDPIVDDPQVSTGLQDLWTRSNPDANLAERRETAGWIVQTAAGYSIVPITTASAGFGCARFVGQPPANGTVVAFVHTHPYQVGETIVDCEVTLVQDYTGAPSDEDRRASQLLGSVFGRSGPLPGYIIDKDGYYRFEGTTNTATPRKPRCGY
jgi:hypothetical protein